jgi:hypothetical protein
MLLCRKSWLSALVLILGALSATAARAADAVEIDPLAPSDAVILAGLNIRTLLEAPLVKKEDLEKLKAALKNNAEAMKALNATGLDPFKDIDSITLAGSGGLANGKLLVVARGRFDLDKIQTAAEAVAKDKPDELKILKEGPLTVYELQGKGQQAGKPGYAAFMNNKTLVLSNSKTYTVETVQGGGKNSGKPTKEMQTALGKLTGKESLWLAMLITEEMKQGLKANPQTAAIASKLQFVTGGITLTDAMLMAFQIQTTDKMAADKVKQMIGQVKPLLQLMAQSNEEAGPILNELIENLKIESNKNNAVTISLKVTQEMAEKLKKDK